MEIRQRDVDLVRIDRGMWNSCGKTMGYRTISNNNSCGKTEGYRPRADRESDVDLVRIDRDVDLVRIDRGM